MRAILIRLGLVLLIFGIIAYSIYVLRGSNYYPYVVVHSPEGLTFTYLRNEALAGKSCVASTDTIIRIIQANCPMCKVFEQRCLEKLPPDLNELHSSKPIGIPSLSMPDGVIAFDHPDRQVAQATCNESQRLAHLSIAAGKEPRVICYPQNTLRPLQINRIQTSETAKLAAATLGKIYVFLCCIITLILGARHFTTRNPLYADDAAISHDEEAFKSSNLIKRILDISVSIAVLLLFLPALSLAALAVFILEGPPIFYLSKRFISRDKEVPILKFRTMVKDVLSPKYRLRERFMRDGYLDIPLKCEIYTPIGRMLERSQLVEVFQLFNIIFHGMSLIGNRPLPRENVELLKKFKGSEKRFDSPAGLSGLSQVVGKLNQTPEERVELESLYSRAYQNKDANILLCDLPIIYYTVRLLLIGKYLPIEQARKLVEKAYRSTSEKISLQ